jgi:hypothetical protein
LRSRNGVGPTTGRLACRVAKLGDKSLSNQRESKWQTLQW